jgi:small subunit ribosomal protein S16
MVKIRLARFGKKGQPIYRIVVIESGKKRDGKYLEAIGFYNPNPDPPLIKIDKPRYLDWLKKGAQPTTTVANLAKKISV